MRDEDKQKTQPAPWERQADEGEREWASFKAYRDQVPPRNYQRGGHLGGVAIATAELSRWYREFNWDMRCKAFDVMSDQIVAAARKKVLEQSAEDVTADTLLMLNDLNRMLANEVRKFLDASLSQDGVGLIKAADMKGLIEVGIKMRRLALGESTEITEDVTDLSAMSIEELRRWHARLSEVGSEKKLPTIPHDTPLFTVKKPVPSD